MKSFEMEVLTPATVSIPPSVKSLVIIDNTLSVNDSVEVDVSGKKGQYLKFNSDTLSKVAKVQLYKTLTTRGFYDTVFSQPKPVYYQNRYVDKQWAAKKSLNEASESYNPDAAVILENVKLVPSIYYEPMTEEAHYYKVTLTIIGHLNWVVVDLVNDTVLDVYTHSDSLFWNSYTEVLEYPVQGLPSFRYGFLSLADKMGYDYTDRICPNWVMQRRYYFVGSSGAWDLANVSLSKNDWEQASKIWFGIYEQSKRWTKACAAHNIALAYEMTGKFDEAVKWAFEANQLLGNLSSSYYYYQEQETQYYETILKRSVDAKKLEEQVGG